MFPGPLGLSLSGKALEKKIWDLQSVDLRSYGLDKHKRVDDPPFGGGAGMVMRPDVLQKALEGIFGAGQEKASSRPYPLIYFSPRGRLFDQNLAKDLTEGPGVVLLCGRYEGVDQRILDRWEITEISGGDFILSGGEIAALTLLDACVRLLPGVVHDAASLEEESFSQGLLEYPHYTQPQVWEGESVPSVLVSGHHGRIKEWRLQESEKITQQRRPDLWEKYIKKVRMEK
jgi:tRNA (guanine37-N1)-methyltransferase